MRVCQPGPVAFHLASTSGGRRSDIDVRGASDFGRPRGRSNLFARAAPNCSTSTSRAGRARRKSAAVHAGLSGSVGTRFLTRVRFIGFALSPVRLPQADHVYSRRAWCVDENVQSSCNRTERSESVFAIFPACVLGNDSDVPFEFRGGLERDSVHVDVAGIFGRVERKVHRFIVYAVNPDAARDSGA